MSEEPQNPRQERGEATAPPVWVELPPGMRDALLDPESWHESLEAYAYTTNLAVALVDTAGHLLGTCINPQPTWSVLHAHQNVASLSPVAAEGGCPFALVPRTPCTCIADALATRELVLRRDRTRLVHFTVPLVLGNQPLGGLLAGQVFDQYPEQLPLEHVAKHCGLPPGALWQCARLEHPVKQATLHVYGRLLATLGHTFLLTRYHTLLEAMRLEVLEQRVQERTAQLRQSQAQLRALLARLESLREAERTRLARDMHDALSQQLTGIQMDLRWMAQKLGTPVDAPTIALLLDRVVDASDLVKNLLGSVQAIAADLRPSVLDKLGLGAALHEEARRFQARTAIAVTAHLPDFELALPPALTTALFRIFQECLTNIARHAGATQVKVALTAEDSWVTLRVQDNGRGITDAESSDPGALGLMGMRERAAVLGGEVHFTRGPAHGTLVTARLPQHGKRGGRRGVRRRQARRGGTEA